MIKFQKKKPPPQRHDKKPQPTPVSWESKNALDWLKGFQVLGRNSASYPVV